MENATDEEFSSDQYFLLYFIMGAYFAPHLKNVQTLKSPWQRHTENLPSYNASDLADSKIKTKVIESVYYFILTKAEKSFIVNQPSLMKFIHGNLSIPPEKRSTAHFQFDQLFPSSLHPHESDSVGNIIFLDNPEISYIIPEYIERFKSLTGLQDFCLDRESVILHIDAHDFDNKCTKSPSIYEAPMNNSPQNGSIVVYNPEEQREEGIMFLPYCPSKEEWGKIAGSVKNGLAVTGAAAKGEVGPVLGLMDIGESEDSYLFRVALPGVKRDERDFSCEVESNGKVLIKGVTVTGEKSIEKHSQIFEMQSQNLCPPGPFSISFMLPGPVDPRQFHGTFSTDGILEGIAIKPM